VRAVLSDEQPVRLDHGNAVLKSAVWSAATRRRFGFQSA
jgi:hypothetical protein